MRIYWQRGGASQSERKVLYDTCPTFCDNVYIGIPWVLSHPEVVAVNKGPIMFLFRFLSSVVVWSDCVWFASVSVCVFLHCSPVVIFIFVRLLFM